MCLCVFVFLQARFESKFQKVKMLTQIVNAHGLSLDGAKIFSKKIVPIYTFTSRVRDCVFTVSPTG